MLNVSWYLVDGAAVAWVATSAPAAQPLVGRDGLEEIIAEADHDAGVAAVACSSVNAHREAAHAPTTEYDLPAPVCPYANSVQLKPLNALSTCAGDAAMACGAPRAPLACPGR